MTPFLPLLLAASLAGPGHDEPVFAAPSCGRLGWYEPQVGDLIILQHTGALLNILYSVGCSGGATHSAVVVARPDGSLGMLEAPGTDYPVMISNIPARLQCYPGRIWVRRRRVPLTPEQCRRLTEFACAQDGKGYDRLGFLFPMFACPVRKHKRRCLTEEDLNPPRWFCSSLCVGAYAAAGLIDGSMVRIRHTDPEDLKTDKPLDLSRCWEDAVRWHRCGEQTNSWWSRTCCGKTQWWRN